MLNSKFDLYNSEWLELVFSDRNQNYGAYDLRKHYADNVSKAMILTFLGVAVLIGALSINYSHHVNASLASDDIKQKVIPVILTEQVHQAVKKVEPVKSVAPPKAPPVSITKFLPPVVTPDDKVTEEPPKIIEIKGAVGPVEVKNPGGDQAVNASPTGNGGPGDGSASIDNSTYNANEGDLEFMPEPVGGEKAWAKFLQKNLRFPAMAQEQGVSGKVFVSFIIEKDGKLSNITVLRKAGYGFDEESLRVLKLAPAWKPGRQNGQNVRVQYTLPLSFSLADQ